MLIPQHKVWGTKQIPISKVLISEHSVYLNLGFRYCLPRLEVFTPLENFSLTGQTKGAVVVSDDLLLTGFRILILGFSILMIYWIKIWKIRINQEILLER